MATGNERIDDGGPLAASFDGPDDCRGDERDECSACRGTGEGLSELAPCCSTCRGRGWL
jgi:hypothetical protein